jgi:glycosyltransferase involved in cell wall biosynthesis
LEQHGIVCDVVPMIGDDDFPRSRKKGDWFWKSKTMLAAFLNRWHLASTVREYDLVYVLKGAYIYGPPLIERRIREAGVPMVFDFDDAIHIHKKSTNSGIVDYLKSTNRVSETIKMVDQVIVPNDYLASYSRQFNPHVTVVAEAEDTDKFIPRSEHKNDSSKIIVGWVGSPSTVKYLNLVEPAMRQLCERFPYLVFRVIGGQFAAEGVRVDNVAWSLDKEVELFHGLDIGIMPLPLEEWSKGKSGCKLRQYMASGVPGVATRIGYNCELVEDGVTGFLVESQQEWIDALAKLIEQPELRNEIAARAREDVVRRFSIPVIGPQLKQALQDVVHRYRSEQN